MKKFKSEFHVFGWFLGLKNLDVFRKPFCGASLEIIFKQKQFHRASFFLFLFFFFRFSYGISYGLEESKELRALIRWILG